MKDPIRLLTDIYHQRTTKFGEGLTIPYLVGCCTSVDQDAEARICALVSVLLDTALPDGFEFRLQSCGEKDILALKRKNDPPHDRLISVVESKIRCRAAIFSGVQESLSLTEFVQHLVETYAPIVAAGTYSWENGKWIEPAASELKNPLE